MKTVKVGKLSVPAIVTGCMRLAEFDKQKMNHFIHTSIELGVNFFDHADIYGGGKSEEIFGDAMKGDSSLSRESMIIRSKCGIRSGHYDLSKEYIINSVDGILNRLQMDYLDILLLHWPDALVEPEEVAEAFDKLEQSGKVRAFGVSNHTGTTSEDRLLENAAATDITLSREEWYQLYLAAGLPCLKTYGLSGVL